MQRKRVGLAHFFRVDLIKPNLEKVPEGVSATSRVSGSDVALLIMITSPCQVEGHSAATR